VKILLQHLPWEAGCGGGVAGGEKGRGKEGEWGVDGICTGIFDASVCTPPPPVPFCFHAALHACAARGYAHGWLSAQSTLFFISSLQPEGDLARYRLA